MSLGNLRDIVFVRFRGARLTVATVDCHGVGWVNNTLDLLSDEFQAQRKVSSIRRAYYDSLFLIKHKREAFIVAVDVVACLRLTPTSFFLNSSCVKVDGQSEKINSSKHQSLINRISGLNEKRI